jgi:2,3,4,5-tetrahydropyridine-2,6-dicarboxylate N-succinyltransferase
MSLETLINDAFENRASLSPATVSAEVREAILESLNLLDSGQARVAEKKDGQWVVNQWLKKAVLLSFRVTDNRVMAGGETQYFDKVERPARVRIRYLNRDGQSVEEEASGLYAVCIQHEMDHLEGVLFIDHLSRLKRDRAISKVKKAARAA